jgi:hypothetical protein
LALPHPKHHTGQCNAGKTGLRAALAQGVPHPGKHRCFFGQSTHRALADCLARGLRNARTRRAAGLHVRIGHVIERAAQPSIGLGPIRL